MIYAVIYIVGALLTAAIVASFDPHDEAGPVVFGVMWPLLVAISPLVAMTWVGRRAGVLWRRRRDAGRGEGESK